MIIPVSYFNETLDPQPGPDRTSPRPPRRPARDHARGR
jgi:hypothetical protein